MVSQERGRGRAERLGTDTETNPGEAGHGREEERGRDMEGDGERSRRGSSEQITVMTHRSRNGREGAERTHVSSRPSHGSVQS